jgi:beta-lactamase superfamily II metal-dependent hydrolase
MAQSKTKKKTAKTKKKATTKTKTKAKKKTKVQAKAKTKKAKVKTSPNSKSQLRVRMYRVGFGDFFLITVPSTKGDQHILVDCGVTKGTSGKGDIATIKAAVRHMAKETKYKLALIIVTHRHQDHIVGFSRCSDEFTQFEVGAIWMPFWETEYAAKVSKFQQDLEAVAFSLQAAALAATPSADTNEILGIIENATGVSPKEGPGGGSNAASLDLLKTKLGVKPQYLAKGDHPKLPAGLVAAGLAAEILGPPPEADFEFLKLKDLKKGTGQYFGSASAVSSSDKGRRLMPFGTEFLGSADDYPPSAFHEFAPRAPAKTDYTQRYPKELEAAVREATPDALFRAAKTLDGILNNQSLVVLFTWKGKKLLFAGDAQAGNWEYWLYDLDKTVKDPSAEKMGGEGAQILGSLDFYKVGHHGSTNATPIAAVEAMGGDFVSMCSTEQGTFGKVENQGEVPRIPLLNALAKRSTVMRSDQIPVAVEGIKLAAAVRRDAKKPARGKFVVGSCYVDYLLG